MVMGVAAVRRGHRRHRVVPGAALPDGVEHVDNVADHPHAHGAPQVIEAVHVVVQRRALGTELGRKRVDGERVPAFAVQKCQGRVDDRVSAQPRGTPARGAGRLSCHMRDAPSGLVWDPHEIGSAQNYTL
jgi:hypothetical protein